MVDIDHQSSTLRYIVGIAQGLEFREISIMETELSYIYLNSSPCGDSKQNTIHFHCMVCQLLKLCLYLYILQLTLQFNSLSCKLFKFNAL